jgi:2'-5' RNA ligase
VAQPLATELDGLRRALGASELTRVPPHLTLVSPVNLRDKDLLAAMELVLKSAAKAGPLRLRLGPATSFEPATPTVHLGVSGESLDDLLALRSALVDAGPMSRPDPHEFVPHVTLAQEVAAERIAPAVEALRDWHAEVTFDRVHVLVQGKDQVWKPFAEASLGAPAVVGRGGVELSFHRSARPEPEAAALLAVDGAVGGDGVPFAVSARLGPRVAGAAWGWTSGSVTIVADLAVAEVHRGQGIGRALLAAVEAEAVTRGCDVVLVAAPGGGAAGALLTGAGWQAAGDAVADGRRLWRRALNP